MTVLRECPEHLEAMLIINGLLRCPIMLKAPWSGDPFEPPKVHRCPYGEPLPPDLAMQAAGMPRLPGMEPEA